MKKVVCLLVIVLIISSGCSKKTSTVEFIAENSIEEEKNASSPESDIQEEEEKNNTIDKESMSDSYEPPLWRDEEITFEKLTDEQAIVYNEIMEKYKKYLEQKKKQSQFHYGISVFAYYKAIGKGTELSDVVVRTKKTQVIEKYDSIKLTPVFESPSLSDCYFIRASYDEIIDMYFNSDIIEVLHIAKECAHVPDIINDYLIFNVYNDCPEMVASFWDQWSDVVVFMGEDGCYKVYWQCVPE